MGKDLSVHINKKLRNGIAIFGDVSAITAAIYLLRDFACRSGDIALIPSVLTVFGVLAFALRLFIFADERYPDSLWPRWVIGVAAALVIGVGIFPGGLLLAVTC